MSKEIEYRDEKARCVQRMRELLDRAEAESRNLETTEQDEFKRLEGRVLELDEMIEREARVAAMERALEQPVKDVPMTSPTGGAEERRDPRASEEYRQAFLGWVRSGRQQLEARDLYKGSDPAGGYLIPTTLEARIVELASEQSVMRRLAEVVVSSTLVKIPVEATIPTFAYVSEKGTYGEVSGTLDVVNLDAYKAGGVIKVSEELLADSAVDLEAYLARQCARAMAALENNSFFVGTGSGQPRGVTLDAEVGVTTASSTAITFDEVKTLPFQLDDAYLARAAWVMHPATALAIALLKDSNGQYYWPLQEQLAKPRTLLGYPLYTVSTMPQMAAGNVVAVFGDFGFYRIQDRAGMTFLKMVELYSTSGQIGFRPSFRHDGALLLSEAVQALKMKTA